jgi:hypothetical protein
MLSIDSTNGVENVRNWLDYNSIRYQYQELWSAEHNNYNWPEYIENCILVVSPKIIFESLKTESSKQQLINFCNRKNQIWTLGLDSGAKMWGLKTTLLEIDKLVPKHSIFLILDAEFTKECQLNSLVNIKVLFFNFILKTFELRCQASSLIKNSAHYDFLLTMLNKPHRPGRQELWKALHQRPELANRGLISYSKWQDHCWIGQTPAQHDNPGLHTSMDLYLDCYLEIVPECVSEQMYDFTEKTVKPILTKTPFLIVSAPGHLKWLHTQGFKTFGSLIDETYDCHLNMEDKVKHVIDVLTDIIRNGSQNFYLASQSILDYNFSRLCELSGSWNLRFDEMMFYLLDNYCQIKKQ